ncbi:sensor histidine kinase [Streptomyces sp. NBC_00162]|uniref:sensor histidine kinase n=1 Tax=Streptomyces sp. NBC_00162 TaxID=2903629 RepID=UPI00214A989C|nr:HAMP domain-containing sensor histidine kinase [Streptomyces sp. NBC_00162]UUU43852.1 HAMP domain-containing sensor histidine kinase [Streptomyces sp. NBC_00162]
MSLYWRIFLLNAAVLVAAVLLLLGPVTVSTPVLFGEAVVLLAGLVAMLIANAVLLRIGLAPLGRLTRAMTAVDLLRPGSRARVEGPGEVAELTTSFNAMLGRLEAERATSSARALSAQEAERRRIAQELHDEVGQTLTAVLLQLKHVADRAPAPLREDLHQVQETTRTSLDEIRRIARRLRPGVLEELGLHSALRALTAEFTTGSLRVRHVIAPGLPSLDDAAELVVYRVAQEALTNAVRHAGASDVEVHLSSGPGGQGGPGGAVRLLVRDNGKGIRRAAEGAGIQGMRERALLIGADLAVADAPHGGTDVRLDVPVSDATTDGLGRGNR